MRRKKAQRRNLLRLRRKVETRALPMMIHAPPSISDGVRMSVAWKSVTEARPAYRIRLRKSTLSMYITTDKTTNETGPQLGASGMQRIELNMTKSLSAKLLLPADSSPRRHGKAIISTMTIQFTVSVT